MSKTYVIADLHGRYDLLNEALNVIGEDQKIIFTGDYIDRGPHSCQVVSRLIEGQKAGRNWICLMGNHEDMMVEGHSDIFWGNIWRRNGGDKTLASYLNDDENLLKIEHIKWMKKLPLFYEDKERIYVHAFVSPNSKASKQNKESLLWDRYGSFEGEGYFGKHVVHGHTPKPNGPELLRWRTNLDVQAVYTGRLVIGVFDDDKPGGPVNIMEVIIRPEHTKLKGGVGDL